MRPYITQVTGFVKNAFIPGEAYRIQLKTESAVRHSIDCDKWDDISSTRTGSMMKVKVLDVMDKGVAAIFLGLRKTRRLRCSKHMGSKLLADIISEQHHRISFELMQEIMRTAIIIMATLTFISIG